jgi:uroporphyrinogen-III synthase
MDTAEAAGWRVDVVPEHFVAESLAQSMEGEDLDGCHVLIPCAADARAVVPRALAARGAVVHVVEAYRNEVPPGTHKAIAELFSSGASPDWITFASPSAVEHFFKFAKAEMMGRCRVASIGPVTSAAIAKHGLVVHAQPHKHTADAMVEAMVASAY